jgi:peptidoglycan/LPS O-acetylase OafA/YrhL
MKQQMKFSPDSQPKAEPSPYARHIPALDGLRGLAALSVVVSHVFPGTAHTTLEMVFWHIAALGAGGVDLFFGLSGFLITGILHDSLSDPAFFRKFYARRALRIFPLYYGVLALFGMAALLFGLHFHGQLLSLALYLQNTQIIAAPIFEYNGPTVLPLGHFWSLAIEEQFYLVWPVAVFLLRKKVRLLGCCAIFLVLCPMVRTEFYLHGVANMRMNASTLCRADSLLAGAALALLLRTRFHEQALRSGKLLFAVGAVALLVMGPMAPYYLTNHSSALCFAFVGAFEFSAVAMASTGLIALALHSPAVKRLFSNPTLRSVGKYSYGIYVLHVPLFYYLGQPCRSALRSHVTGNRVIGILLTGLICLAVTGAGAYLSYNFYEKRFLGLKRFFEYRDAAKAAG